MPAPRPLSALVPREVRLDALDLSILCTLAFGARLYDLLARHPSFFTSRESGPADVLLVVLAVGVAVPGGLALATFLLGACAGPAARRAAVTALLALFAAAVVLPLLKQVAGLPAAAELGLAALAGAAVALGLRRGNLLRRGLRILWPVLIIAPGRLLLGAPWSQLAAPAPAPLQSASAPTSPANPVPVVLVVFDEFSGTTLMDREGRIDPRRWPNFAALGRRATWFANATTNGNFTEAIVPAMLSGRLPRWPVPPPTRRHYPDNLFALLEPAYQLHVREHFTRLGPRDAGRDTATFRGPVRHVGRLLADLVVLEAHLLLPRDVPGGLPELGSRFGEFRPDDPDDVFERFLADIRPSDRPTLDFVHVLLPHVPYVYSPGGRYPALPLPDEALGNPNLSDGLVGRREHPSRQWLDEEWTTVQARQRYLLQVGYVDRLVGRLVERLETGGLFDRCLLIITADHGRSFRSHHRADPARDAIDPEIASIPLLVKLPGQREGRISTRNVQSVDLLPMIAGVLRLPLPPGVEGHSALDASAPEPKDKLCLVQWRDEGPAHWFRLPAAVPRDEAVAAVDRLFGAPEESGSSGGPGLPNWDVAPGQTEAAPSGDASRGDRPPGFWSGPYRAGPNADLLGRLLDTLYVAPESAIRGEWTFRGARSAAHGEGFDGLDLPCYIGGRVSLSNSAAATRGAEPLALPVELAVALGSRVVAVTRTYRIPGLETCFTAVLPDEAIQPRGNRLELFAVDREQGRPRLRPVAMAPDGDVPPRRNDPP